MSFPAVQHVCDSMRRVLRFAARASRRRPRAAHAARTVLAVLLLTACDCVERPKNSGTSKTQPSPNAQNADAAPRTAEAPPEAPAPRVPLPVHDEHQWLFVEAIHPEAPVGWATASFDRDRNKLSVTTRDVTRFAVNTALTPIDWDRRVILSIDGKNSQLRRRDVSVLHVERDDYGEWQILEPPSTPTP